MAQQQDEVEDVSDDVLGNLLASVTQNAKKMNDKDFQYVDIRRKHYFETKIVKISNYEKQSHRSEEIRSFQNR